MQIQILPEPMNILSCHVPEHVQIPVSQVTATYADSPRTYEHSTCIRTCADSSDQNLCPSVKVPHHLCRFSQNLEYSHVPEHVQIPMSQVPQPPMQILPEPMNILHVSEPVQIPVSQVPEPPVQIPLVQIPVPEHVQIPMSQVPQPPMQILPEPMNILHVSEPVQISDDPEPVQIPVSQVPQPPLQILPEPMNILHVPQHVPIPVSQVPQPPMQILPEPMNILHVASSHTFGVLLNG
ncbi:hypothetical protein TNCV_3373591 [Trichonephila clavipes]|nr:hypothetical protein TNCV_3373591 [Trichonephila clavipes]